ncbi:MAG: thermonuclease family protein [Proteobacteria bacterium]|nr:thermonuclease family protein [Pseudomonadota bacterium]
MRTTLAMAAVLLAVATPGGASAQTVLDGNTIVLEGRHVRLWGIDAPDLHATCSGWPAGEIAAAFLHDLISNRSIACAAHGVHATGKLFGICRAAGVDVGATMVRKGMAWAAVKYTRDYVQQEAAAKAENLGIYAHHCLPGPDTIPNPTNAQ